MPAEHGCDGGYFNGIVGDVGMFNGILTKDDIADLMNKGLAKTFGLTLSVSTSNKLFDTWGAIKHIFN